MLVQAIGFPNSNTSLPVVAVQSLEDLLRELAVSQNKEPIYEQACNLCGFHNKEPEESWEQFFCSNAAEEILSQNRELVVSLKDSFDRQRESQYSRIESIFFTVLDSLVTFFQDLKLAWALYKSDDDEKSSLGSDILLINTVYKLGVLPGLYAGTSLLVSAISFPFFASSIGIIGIGAFVTGTVKLLLGSALEFGFAVLNHVFVEYLWEEEIKEFDEIAKENRLALFIAKQIKTNCAPLDGVNTHLIDQFKNEILLLAQ